MDFIKSLKNKLFDEKLDIQIKAFNVVGLGGIAVCLTLLVYGMIAGEDWTILTCYFGGIIFSVMMLFYTLKTGKYQIAMMITIAVVFLGLFTFIFFQGGGYHSGAPLFFVFAIVFTAFLLQNRVGIVFIIIEVVWYNVICIIAYKYPETVTPLDSEKNIMVDIISCAVISGLILANTMYLLLKVYRTKQIELAAAKEEAESANNIKTDFLAKMSHDIRTPINTIAVMNDLIVENAESDEIREWATDSETACTLLMTLVNDMLDISKIEAGKVDIHESEFLLQNLLRKIFITWDGEATAKGLKLDIDVDETLPTKVIGSEDSIYKILSNLISNAIKYSNEGIITLSILREGRNGFIFCVEDQGIGIPEEFMDKIFKPFERGAQDYYHSREGSGLGLAIVKELADQMSATLDCESAVDIGSRFKLRIDLRVLDDTPIGKVEEWLGAHDIKRNVNEDVVYPGANLLVVDDNFYNRKVFRALLEPMLFQIDDVESGEEALEMIEIKDYDLILMDYRMPDMSGKEVLQNILENNPEWSTPVVVVTADAMVGTKEELLAAGFDDFISKPINSNQLKDILRKFISNKSKYIEKENTTTWNQNELLEYEALLNGYDINLSEALEVNDNEVDALMVRMELFSSYYDTIRYELINWNESDDSREKIFFTIHSLKSSAKGIGAIVLSQLAALIESKRDLTFYEKMLTVVLSEYELAKIGCDELMEKI